RADGLEQREVRDVVAVERARGQRYARAIRDPLGRRELRRAVDDRAVDDPGADAVLEDDLRPDDLVDPEIPGDRLREEERGRREDREPVARGLVRLDAAPHRRGQVGAHVAVVERLHELPELRQGAPGVAAEAHALRVGPRPEARLAEEVRTDELGPDRRPEEPAADA